MDELYTISSSNSKTRSTHLDIVSNSIARIFPFFFHATIMHKTFNTSGFSYIPFQVAVLHAGYSNLLILSKSPQQCLQNCTLSAPVMISAPRAISCISIYAYAWTDIGYVLALIKIMLTSHSRLSDVHI